MKILMVSPRYYPEIGGVERHVKEISERLVKKGNTVTVLCVDANLKKIKEEKINGVKVIRCPGFAPKGNYHISKTLYKKIKELDYDIIHCHSYNSATTPLAILANNNKKKCVVTFHGYGERKLIKNLLHIPYKLLMISIKNKVDNFICVSDFEKERFQIKLKIPKEKLIVIPNGLDFNEFQGLNKIKIDKNLIIGIGRLEKSKGFHYLIKGFAEAYKEDPSLRLEILGKGNYEKSLRNLVSKLGLEKIIKIMFLERKEMLRHLAHANTFVLLSKYEGQPISVLEAMYLKKKIILSNQGVLKEFIGKNYALGVSDINSKEEIKEKLNSPFKLSTFKLKSWEDIAKSTCNIYNNLLR